MSELANNKKAKYNYHIIETLEAGLSLLGTEVKSCRDKNFSLNEGYIDIRKGGAFLVNVNIAEYDKANRFNHDPMRERQLLLHRQEIKKLSIAIDRKGMTVVPLKAYLKNGRIKLLIGLAKGKELGDKRETIKKREDNIKKHRILKR